jgi:hypothetical protein
MVTIILSAFIGCAEDEAPDYKAEFLGELKTAVAYNEDSIDIVMSGENITVKITGADIDKVKAKADDLLVELKKLADTGTTVTIDGTPFSLYNNDDLSALKTKLQTIFNEDGVKAYKAAIKYKGQSFDLNGNLSVTK